MVDVVGSIFLAPGDIIGPPLAYNPPRCSHFYWHGFNGLTWDLGAADSGVRLVAGVRGLDMPSIDWFTTDAAGVDGTLDRGYRVPAREVFWPLRVMQQPAAQAWVNYNREFWRTLHPGRYGRFEVVQPGTDELGGESRSLRLRLEDAGKTAFDTDPALIGWARYAITLTAPSPYWESSVPVQRTWSRNNLRSFFGGPAGKAPDFHISGPDLTVASLENPGDVEAWPIWTVFGPTTLVSVGLAGKLITVPFTVAAGKAVIIDTDPRRQVAWDANATTGVDGALKATSTGVDLTGQLGSKQWSPLPAANSVPLSLAITGTGSVRVSVLPRYYSAW